MIKTVIKRDGREEPFSVDKLNKWAEYADRVGSCWSTVSLETYQKLGEVEHSTDIHETMIKVCESKESIEFSRVAARLEYATIRKDMATLGMYDRESFKHIYDTLITLGIWCENTLPVYNPLWEEWYSDLKQTYMECWQIQQWIDKYALKYNDLVAETPHVGALGIGLAIWGDDINAFKLAKSVITGKVNLPTPTLNGCRNGDWDSISCCVITGGDTISSIGVANHISYEMTAKKAGIGIEYRTRSKGDDVKGGRVKHLGKEPIIAATDKAVKMFTQVSRGGNATLTYRAVDADIERLLMLKTQRIPVPDRIDKIDYSFAYNDAFLDAVKKDSDWYLFSSYDAPELTEHAFYHATTEEYNKLVKTLVDSNIKYKKIKARDLLKTYLINRQETGRIYCINVTRANKHTPFIDTISLSNLCQEICLPTKPYDSMFDLYAKSESNGETAFCSLGAINVGAINADEEYESLAVLLVQTIDRLIDNAPMLAPSMKSDIMRRRSIGVGITGLATYLYNNGLDYDGSESLYEAVSELAEKHYYYLLKASQSLVDDGYSAVDGIDLNWLPIDTKASDYQPKLDWESLRGKPRRNSVLVAHMPTESSAVFSSALNGLYPQRDTVIYKGSRKGLIQFISNGHGKLKAWDVDNKVLAAVYGRVQDFTDQAISCDYYEDYRKYEDGKAPLSKLMIEWVTQANCGNKTMYYTNTNDDNGGTLQDNIIAEDNSCEGGACKL